MPISKITYNALKALIILAISVFLLIAAQEAQAQEAQAQESAGLDKQFKSLLVAIDAPLRLLIGALVYILGIILVIRGFLRLPKHASRAGDNISLNGTIMSVVIGTILISLPSQLDIFSQSIFGTDSYSYAAFSDESTSQTLGPSQSTKVAEDIIRTVLRFVQLCGLIWFVSAWFNLLDASDGKHGKTFVGGSFRLLASLACWNIFALLQALQTTLNINILEIS